MKETEDNGRSIESKEVIEAEAQTDHTSDKDVVDEFMEGAPVEVRQEITRFMAMQMNGRVSAESELMKKLTPEHLSEFLEGQREASNNQFKESRDNKIFLIIALLVALAFVIVLVVLLRDTPDVLEKILYTLGGLAAGLAGGYGVGKTKGD